MPDDVTPAERYRRLAAECLDAANNFPRGDHKNGLLEMAQVWQRLAEQYDDSSCFPPALVFV